MVKFIGGISKIIAFVTIVLLVMTSLLRMSPLIFPTVPEPSETFDCDDGTLFMYRHFQSLGIDAIPVLGNLEMESELFSECNHVWLLVKSGEKTIAYDWGEPRLDSQHYEGYVVDIEYLEWAVADDFTNPGTESIIMSTTY